VTIERKTTANKRYSKWWYACSLKQLKSLYTFTEKSVQVVLADS